MSDTTVFRSIYYTKKIQQDLNSAVHKCSILPHQVLSNSVSTTKELVEKRVDHSISVQTIDYLFRWSHKAMVLTNNLKLTKMITGMMFENFMMV